MEFALAYQHFVGRLLRRSGLTYSFNRNKVTELADNAVNPVTGERFSMDVADTGGLGSTRFLAEERRHDGRHILHHRPHPRLQRQHIRRPDAVGGHHCHPGQGRLHQARKRASRRQHRVEQLLRMEELRPQLHDQRAPRRQGVLPHTGHPRLLRRQRELSQRTRQRLRLDQQRRPRQPCRCGIPSW